MAALRALVGKGMLPEDILDSHAARSRMSPGGGTALHAAAYTSNAHIALAKALVGHLGAGPHLQRWRRLGLFHPSQVLLLLSLFLSLSVSVCLCLSLSLSFCLSLWRRWMEGDLSSAVRAPADRSAAR